MDDRHPHHQLVDGIQRFHTAGDVVVFYFSETGGNVAQVCKAVRTPGKCRACRLDGFFDVFFLYKVRAQRFHADVGIVEVIADDGEHRSDLIRFHVHGQTFDDEKYFAPHFYLIGPCRIEHGTRNRGNAAGFLIDRIAYLNRLRQIEIIPGDFSIIHAVKPCVQTTGDVDDGTIRVLSDKVADQLIKYNTPRYDSAAHCCVLFRIAEIIVDAVNQLFCFGVAELVFRISAVHGAGVEALQHRLGGSVQFWFYFFIAHSG